ncbi:hypothetical protein [Myceligenerans indicum]|uniref:Integral membrane protein n=1 Tax=Myceligenerans indicum TaxID=2593663 RepID=A0ABS1LNX1_9MICO|nr:hypothetical protein [Myceligenerans indicum]MBL0887888.1 hypothetical protein [Myceligenerans indicum]
MSENTPRGPGEPPGEEPGAPGAGEPEPQAPTDRPAGPQQPGGAPSSPEPQRPAGPGGTPSPADTPPGVTAPGSAPPGGYGAQPPGGYGAQPPGGYGAQPPGGYGAQPPSSPTPYSGAPAPAFRVGEALGYGWNKFAGNALLWIVFVLLLLVVSVVFNSGNIPSYQDMWDSSQTNSGVSFGGSLLGLIGAVLAGIVQGLGTNAALREVSGQKPTFGSLFQAPNLGMIIVAALLLIAAEFVGFLVCGIGLLVVLVFAVFTYQGVIDKNQNAWEAFTASFRLVGKNFGAVFLLELALFGINILGLIPCGLGLLITIPLSYIALSFAYRRLVGGPVMA